MTAPKPGAAFFDSAMLAAQAPTSVNRFQFFITGDGRAIASFGNETIIGDTAYAKAPIAMLWDADMLQSMANAIAGMFGIVSTVAPAVKQ